MSTTKLNSRCPFFAFVVVITTIMFGHPAQAVTINSSVGVYEVTFVEGTALDLEALLTVQAWYDTGSDALAREFASLVGTQLGLPNFGILGPYFAYDGVPETEGNVDLCFFNSGPFTNAVQCSDGFVTDDVGRAYAVASQVPEPTTMLLFATGLLGLGGYRWQQRRRERTQVG